MPADSDEQLVLEALSDSHLAFGQLMEQYQYRVLRTIASIISDEEAAQDVAQETFLSAWSNLAKLKEQQKFGRWLNQIAVSFSKRWLRNQRKHQENTVSLDESRVVLTQELRYKREKLRQEVWDAIDALAEDYREVVILHYISGYSYKEISQMLSIPHSTIVGRLQLARNQLRKEFLDMVTKLQLEIDSTVHKFLKERAKQDGVSVEGLIIRLIERYKRDMDSPEMEIRKVWDHPGVPSPDGRYLCFVNRETDGNLAIRDLSTGESRDITDEATDPDYSHVWRGVPFIFPGNRPYVWSPDGAQIAYGWWNEDHGELRIIGQDGSEPRVLYHNPGNVRVYDWSQDGKFILARFLKPIGSENLVNETVLVSVADGSVHVLESLKSLDANSSMSLSPDGRHIAYDRVEEGLRDIFLSAIDGSGEEVPLAPEHPDGHDTVPIWGPDGKTIVFRSYRDRAYGSTALFLRQVVDGRPVGEPQFVKREVGTVSPVGFTQDGSLYYSTWMRQSDIYVASLDTETGEILDGPTLLRSEGLNSHPDWAPDGKSLAYQSGRRTTKGFGQRGCIVIRSMETGSEREFLPSMGAIGDLRWSPDGRSILFRLRSAGPNKQNASFHLLDIQTGRINSVVKRRNGESIHGHVWSPDGKTIFYHHRLEGKGEWTCSIMMHDLETGQRRELCHGGSLVSHLYISPDGQQLAFSDEGYRTIKLVSTKEGEPTELLRMHNGSDEIDECIYPHAWTSDGRHLLFLKERWLPPDDSRGWQLLPWELWRIPAEGGEPRKLLAAQELMPGASLWDSSFHPDGNRIAFIRARSDRELWVIENLLSVFAADK